MRTLRTAWSRIRSLWRRPAVKREIDEELRFHIEQRTEENIAAGAPPEEAAREARRGFGNFQSVREECRDVRGASFGETLLQDARFGLRMLRKNPGFATVAVLTLALCVGANLAIFTVVDTVLLRPLPFPQSERLVAMFNEYPMAGLVRQQSSFPNLYTRRGKLEALSSIAAYKQESVVVGEAGRASRIEALLVSPEFFETLGVRPLLGRPFTEEEMTTPRAAMLSYSYWQETFGGYQDVLGREIRVLGRARLVVGVLPPSFHFLSSQARLYLPLASHPVQRGIDNLHESAQCEMIGRLKPGATLAVAQAQVDAHNAAVGRGYPWPKPIEDSGFRTRVAPLHANHVESIRPTLWLLQAGGGCLLLIGAVNLVNLSLVRASTRARELVIRRVLGAGRLRVVRLLMIESGLLTLVGGLCGLGLGALGIRLFAVLGAAQVPLGAQVALDGRIAMVALLGVVGAGMVVGVPSARLVLQRGLVSALQSDGRGSTPNHSAQRLRLGFVTAQLTLAFVLLAGAGLLAVSLKRTVELSPGFRPDHVLAGRISMLRKDHFTPVRLAFAERVVEGIRSLPGVQAVGIANNLPMGGGTSDNLSERRAVTTVGLPALSALRGPDQLPIIYGVVGDYFGALGIPLQAGRLFGAAESGRDERVCIVDETFARRNWPEGEALGQPVYAPPPDVEPNAPPFTVIGVVGAVKQTDLTKPQADGALYFPFRSAPLVADGLYVMLRTSQRPESMALIVQKVVREIDPEFPVTDLRTMETRIADSLVMWCSPLVVAGGFAALALVLAGVGTYGVLSYAVAQHRREIGVRMALGALPGQIGRQFLALGLRLLALGAVLGIPGAWLTGHAMQSILFDVPPFHIPTLVGSACVLGVAALVACWLPALRASRVDPMEVLKCE